MNAGHNHYVEDRRHQQQIIDPEPDNQTCPKEKHHNGGQIEHAHTPCAVNTAHACQHRMGKHAASKQQRITDHEFLIVFPKPVQS